MAFGRKGLVQGLALADEIVPAPRIEASSDSLADLRNSFIASERARRGEPDGLEALRNNARPAAMAAPIPASPLAKQGSSQHTASPAADAWHLKPSTGPKKSMLLAYVLWYFGCVISAHRFYLGQTKSALQQCGAFFGGAIIGTIGGAAELRALTMVGVAMIGLSFLWMIADMFFIPGMTRRANAAQVGPEHAFA